MIFLIISFCEGYHIERPVYFLKLASWAWCAGLAAALICSLYAYYEVRALHFYGSSREYFYLKFTASSDWNSNTEQNYAEH